MSWQDRVKPAAYITPSGTRLEFLYENVSKSVVKKGTAFEFPDVDGTLVQQHGRTGRRVPLRIFFSGDNYDTVTDTFEDGLLENGVGRLEHPLYGSIEVVPLGDIRRRDDLKTAGNQAVLEVTFWETTGVIFPAAQADPGAELTTKIDEYNTAAAEQFENDLDLDTVVERSTFGDSFINILTRAKTALQTVADVQQDVKSVFDSTFDSINSGIDILVFTPLTLSFQASILMQAPGRALTAIRDRLDAYFDFANTIITGSAIRSPELTSESENAFHHDDAFATAAVTGALVSVINTEFDSRPQALSIAEEILIFSDTITAWRDANYQSFSKVDTGELYQKFQEAVALAAGFLVEISFSLKQERRIVLDRARTILDLEAELYGTIDENLNFIITTNDLTASEVLELPVGREILYYI